MRTTLIACAVATAALLVSSAAAPQLASADDKVDRARAHYQRGVELFNQSKFKAAIAEFAAADGIAPSAILEYNMALCYDRLGEHDEALRRYRLYLKRVPTAANRAVVEDKIARLEKLRAGTSKPDPEPYETLPDDPDPAPDVDPDGPDNQVAPRDDADPEPDDGGATGSARTGDPELDRVAAIDVASIRDERGVGGATTAPDPGGGAAENPPPAPIKDPGNEPAPRPIYKRWWFWVVVGVSALILIDIASSGPDDDTATRVFDPSLDQRFEGMSRSGGLTLRF
jgi:hypothetical protein